MENASKVLIIAGSVLVSILTISVGVQVYNSMEKEVSKQAKQTSETMWEGVDMSVVLDTNLGLDISDSKISTFTSYEGCYANLDDDPEPEGIIFIDLAKSTSGSWIPNDKGDSFSYTIKNETKGLKEYYESEEIYTGGPFPDAKVITVSPDSTEYQKDRFYVMALEDINPGERYYWYNYASGKIDDYKDITGTKIGTGKANTKAMLEKWNNEAYGAKYVQDMWGVIKNEETKGWFVPSAEEWCAFGDALNITIYNYTNYGINVYYWTSSLYSLKEAYYADFNLGVIDDGGVCPDRD